MIPCLVPTGRLSHCRTSTVRAGSAAASVVASTSTRRRAVRSSGRTSSLVTELADQPRPRAISRPSRPFRSSATSIACMSGTTDLTSTTSNDELGGWMARTSTEPRSPRMANDTSAAVSHCAAPRIASVRSTSTACRLSRSRSSPSPCQRSRSSSRAPSAAATRWSVWTATPVRLAAFGAADHRTGQANPPSELALTPAASSPQCSNAQAKSDRIHFERIRIWGSLGLIPVNSPAWPRRSAGRGRSRYPT